MPQAKPTQVIVHRIELQQSERRQLEEFLDIQKNVNIANSASRFVGPLAIGGAVVGSVWIGAKVWAAVQAALMGPIEEAKEYVETLFDPVDRSEGGRDSQGNLQDVRENLSESGNIFTETVKNPTVRNWVLSPTISLIGDALTPDDSTLGTGLRAYDRAVDDFFSKIFD